MHRLGAAGRRGEGDLPHDRLGARRPDRCRPGPGCGSSRRSRRTSPCPARAPRRPRSGPGRCAAAPRLQLAGHVARPAAPEPAALAEASCESHQLSASPSALGPCRRAAAERPAAPPRRGFAPHGAAAAAWPARAAQASARRPNPPARSACTSCTTIGSASGSFGGVPCAVRSRARIARRGRGAARRDRDPSLRWPAPILAPASNVHVRSGRSAPRGGSACARRACCSATPPGRPPRRRSSTWFKATPCSFR